MGSEEVEVELPLTGGCGCGRVRWELSEVPVLAGYCHCTRCRRRTGTAAAASAFAAPETFRITEGEGLVRVWSPEGGASKHFCGECGSALFSRRPGADGVIGVRLGSFDADPGVRPSRRQFTASACVWEAIPDDGLTRYEGSAPR